LKIRPSARDKLRAFFRANLGKTLRTQQLREVAGINDYARRIRELRDEEGMVIKSHNERDDLRPDEYVLESLEVVPVANPIIPEEIRRSVLLRDGLRCRFCGASQDSAKPSRPVRLRIDFINPQESGGGDHLELIAVMCGKCTKSRDRTSLSGHSAQDLVALIRRASPAVQREVYLKMTRSFERFQKH
jgi:hypothetical protein